MMTDFVQRDLPGILKAEAVQTLYLRPSAILVRPGNPKRIHGIKFPEEKLDRSIYQYNLVVNR